MNLQDLKMLASGSVWLTKLPFNMMSRSSIDFPIYYAPAWEEEKTEILERANWLCDNVIISPKQLLNKMPALLWPNYRGQWAIYLGCMLAFALRIVISFYEDT